MSSPTSKPVVTAERVEPVSEQQFRLFADSLPQMAWMAEADGNIFWYNRRWYEYTGADLEQMRGWGWQSVHHPEMLPLVNERWRRCIETGKPLEMEFPLRGADGVYRWFLTRATPVFDDRNRLHLWVGTNTDVSELRQMREKLQVFRDRLDLCAEGAELGIWLCDLPLDKLNWSPRVKQHFGVPLDEEVTIQTFWDRLHPEDRERTRLAMESAIDEGAPYDIEYRTIGLDHRERWVRATGAVFRDEAGVPRRFDGITLDITERKTAEEQRKEYARRARRGARVTRLLNQVGPMLIGELDLDRLTQKVTDIATQLIGARFGALFHNVVDEKGESYMLYTLSGVPREAFAGFPMPRNTEVFQETFSGGSAVRSGDIRKDPRYGKNPPHYGMPEGHLPVRSYLAVPVVSRSSEVLGGLFFGHDEPNRFTEQHERTVAGIAALAGIAIDNARLFETTRRTQEALSLTNRDLRRLNEDLNQFAYSASHDLQEPLRHIVIYSQLLQRRCAGTLDGPGEEYLQHCIQAAERMETLVRDLLSYTQAVSVPPQIEGFVEVAAVAKKALANLDMAIRDADAEVTVEPLPALPVLEVHLLQLFQNLIGNALKYRRDGVPCRIRVSAERAGAEWRLSVEDNGIGIAPEYHDRIFGVFKRLHTNEKFSGTGIGLAICQKLVEQYGGRIWVESELGQGAKFVLTVPAGQEARS